MINTHAPSIEDWGFIPYESAWNRQKEIQKQVIAGNHPGCLVFCEHPPTVTAGSSTQESSFVVSPEHLKTLGIEFFKVERGGDLTFHGPGQLVCYPLLDLNKLKRDVHWYMRALEGAIITTCAAFGVSTERIQGRTGVWIASSGNVKPEGPDNGQPLTGRRRKIASIGVRLSRWCSMHGLSLNVMQQPDIDKLIVPCGLTGISVTSLELERTEISNDAALGIQVVATVLRREIGQELGIVFEE